MAKYQYDLKLRDFTPIEGLSGRESYLDRAIGNDGTLESWENFLKDSKKLGELRYMLNVGCNFMILVCYNVLTSLPYGWIRETRAAKAEAKTKKTLLEKIECHLHAHY